MLRPGSDISMAACSTAGLRSSSQGPRTWVAAPCITTIAFRSIACPDCHGTPLQPVPRHPLQPARAAQDAGLHGRRHRHGRADALARRPPSSASCTACCSGSCRTARSSGCSGSGLTRSAAIAAPFNVPDFIDYRDSNRTLSGFAGFFGFSANVSDETAAERVQGIRATGNLFDVLGAEARERPPARPGDERAGAERVVVLAEPFWRRRFGGDPAIVGRAVRLSGESHTVVGMLADRLRDADPGRRVRAAVRARIRIRGAARATP